jgi:multidrug efflux pump subunit AcrA (membrane-fusion protein)
MRKFVLPVTAAVLFLLGLWSVARTQPRYPPAAPIAAPPSSPFAATVAGVGLVEARTENLALSVPVAGLVSAVHVQVGETVPAGHVLFTLDDRDVRAEVALRREELATAQRERDRLRQTPRPEEVPVVEATVREAEQALADAQVQRDVLENVSDRRAVRMEDLRRRQIAAQLREAQLARARASLALITAGPWSADLAVADARVAAAEARVRRAEADLERLVVRAPVPGSVLRLNVRPGEFAQTGRLREPLVVFGAIDTLHVRVEIDESEGWKVAASSPAFAVPRGQTGVRLPLTFVRVEPYVTPKQSLTGDSSERVDTRVRQIVYRLSPGSRVAVGQQVDVFIGTPDQGGRS